MLISWNSTNACNLQCQHCYRDAGVQAKDELNTAEARRLIDEVAGTGFKIFIFSGGEPLMRPDIFELTAHARKQGLKPVIGTNGTLITGETARQLKGCGAAAIGISLDSVDEVKHDRFRAVSGSWQAAVGGMQACREAGLAFQVHTTVMEWNESEVEAITDFAVDIGASAHHIFFLVPAGRAVNLEAESLRAVQYEQLLRRIMDKQRTVPIELKPTCAPQFMRITKEMGVPTRFTMGCLAGIAYCIVNPRGIVQPCAYLDIPAGDVRRIPFQDIWQNAEVFKRLRTRNYTGGCGNCTYHGVCGGCRARAYYYNGDYMAEEPWCLYHKQKGC